MIPLGKIVRLQIQRRTLSLGDRLNRYYDPAGLLAVETLVLSPRGAAVQLPEGDLGLDYHHADYPNGRNEEENDLSINFTAHYEAMREKFGSGERLFDGCGGENILIETAERVTLDRVARGVVVQTREGRFARLEQVIIARPCQPFSKYASGWTEPEAVKGALQFLDNGTRGFYCTFEDEQPVTLAVGDEVFLPTPF